MKLLLRTLHFQLMDLLRQPGYTIPTLAFPSLFYFIFAVPESQEQSQAAFMAGSFCAFAVFGVVFFQFGIGTAQDRTSKWTLYIRTLPAPSWLPLLSRALIATLVALTSAGLVLTLALTLTPARWSWTEASQLLVTLALGSLAFAPMGIAFGYWVKEKTALPLANLVYLPLSYIGGLLTPPQMLPEKLHRVSEWTPTRHYGELVWASSSSSFPSESLIIVIGFTSLFLVFSLLGYRREQILVWS